MKVLTRIVLIAAAGTWLGGCVMTEKYEAEKTRALNFQRLLAQEEKRTGELDAQVKQLKRDAAETEARNRELTAQLQAVRVQLGKTQEDLEVVQAAAATQAARKNDPKAKAAKPKRSEEFEAPLEYATPEDETALGRPAATNGSDPRYHAVRNGENLFRIARKYGVTVEKLRKWNSLDNNDIEVGQKLIVGYE